MKKTKLILLAISLFINVFAAHAQFKKPLPSRFSKSQSSDAQWRIGITGGVNLTQWYHFGGSGTKYTMPFEESLGYMGGLSLEKMIGNKFSVGLDGLYAMRNIRLYHDLDHFPVGLDEWNDITKNFAASYSEAIVQIPLTYYLLTPSTSVVAPYFFAAPRVSIPIDGTMYWHRENHTIPENSVLDTTHFNTSNYAPFNIGLTAGVGFLMRLNMSNYHLILKLDASYHAGFLDTYSKAEMAGEVPDQDVIGSNYIEPRLLGRRFAGDANLKLTLLFPLKRQPKDACTNWGEYD